MFSLFRIDKEWTEKNIISFFSWENEQFALFIWTGFLRGMWINKELSLVLKQDFIKSFKYFDKFTELKQVLPQFLVVSSMDFSSIYNDTEIRQILKHDNIEIRKQVLFYFKMILDDNEKTDTLWNNKIGNWIVKYWPRDTKYKTPELNENFIEIIFSLDKSIPNAIRKLIKFMTKIDKNSNCYFWRSEEESRKLEVFPIETLLLVRKLFNEDLDPYYYKGMREMLSRMYEKNNSILINNDFKYLSDKLKKKGL